MHHPRMKLLLALLSGLLLWLAWPVLPFTLLIFVAWVPLIYLFCLPQKGKHFFGRLYLALLTWNALTTWWIWNATAPGACGAILVNSLLMCLPWLGARHVAKIRGRRAGYLALVLFWLCFEFIHLNDWGLSWPWLTLGNVFATHPDWVQWYEYTGVSGGSLWVLCVNLLVYEWLRAYANTRNWRNTRTGLPLLAVLLLPFIISFLIKNNLKLKEESGYNIIVVQPNIDPYEKISAGSIESQLGRLIGESEKLVNDSTRLIVWPETALYNPRGFDEEHLRENFLLNPLWAFLQKHPQVKLFTGVESYGLFGPESKPKGAKRMGESDLYYAAYNGAVLLDSGGARQTYHKTMLVPGVETLPGFLGFLAPWFEKFGGTGSGYVGQPDRTVIDAGSWKLAPAVCYESIYGRFMSKYVKNGASLITIITNDGWWRNTPGHKQHMNYARLRAIETRRWVARSANTGISCFIRPDGSVFASEPYNVGTAIKCSNAFSPDRLTFYVQYGDLVYWAASGATAIILVGLVYLRFTRKKRQ